MGVERQQQQGGDICGISGYGESNDRVNRKKLFVVMRCYGVHEKLVRLIERIYDGSMVKFELEKVTTGWCKSDSGVRQGCPLSPLIFNIYVNIHVWVHAVNGRVFAHSKQIHVFRMNP